jgi:hypothetical protein
MTGFLDISPLIKALRQRPGEFAWSDGWLRHVPSDHRFKFDPAGKVAIRADCACAALRVHEDQGRELYTVAESFTRDYWRPKVINRHFASHFERPSLLRRFAAWVMSDRGQHHDHDELDLGMELPEDRATAEIFELPAAAPAAPAPERLAA